jgi:hypothetical protein
MILASMYVVMAATAIVWLVVFWTERKSPHPVQSEGHDTSAVIGKAVCNGYTLDINAIRLADGKIHFMCHTFGTLELLGPVTIFGEDGTGVLQGANIESTRSFDSHVWLDLPLRINEVSNDHE